MIYLNRRHTNEYIFSDHELKGCQAIDFADTLQELIDKYCTVENILSYIEESDIMFDVSILQELLKTDMADFGSKNGCGFAPLTEGSKVQDFSDEHK